MIAIYFIDKVGNDAFIYKIFMALNERINKRTERLPRVRVNVECIENAY